MPNDETAPSRENGAESPIPDLSRLPFMDTSLPFDERAADLVSRMTLDEKVSQMVHDAAAVPRLGVPAYNWWNECLHGVGRAGVATVFPQAIALAATFDTDLMTAAATAISDEARAKHHRHIRETGGDSAWYFGLTFWSPNVNIFRDPRWGRGHETYGEDPFLTARMGVAFCRALQGDHSKYLKLVATPKHYAVHSGPEKDRHGFDARVSARDLRETYLPAFRACIVEAKAASIMPAYNRTNGEACGASQTLLGDILRGEWGFDGYVVSDCGAIGDIFLHHRIVATREEAAALAVRNGCDLNCGDTYCALGDAVLTGLLSKSELDRSLRRLFEARFRLGMFDPPEENPYARIPIEVNDSEEHRALALRAAVESIVLLKNDGILPLADGGKPASAGGLKSIAVVGPLADDAEALLGNYNGTPSRSTTPLEGIRRRAGSGVAVRHARGCDLAGGDRSGFEEAVRAARESDLVVLCLGLSPRLEGEEGEWEINPSGDRTDIGLPGVQEDLLEAVAAAGTPVVLALSGGSALAVNRAAETVPAILMTWYGGEEGGAALAAVLWDDENPAGRLPVTFYTSLAQVPPFEEYAMRGRTYRFLEEAPLYPFGHGLSYTRFAYGGLRVEPGAVRAGDEVTVSVEVTNAGDRAGDEVVQLYVTDASASVPVPIRQLRGFKRIRLEPGEKQTISFVLGPEAMWCYGEDGRPMIEAGRFDLTVGGGQPGGELPWVEGEFVVE